MREWFCWFRLSFLISQGLLQERQVAQLCSCCPVPSRPAQLGSDGGSRCPDKDEQHAGLLEAEVWSCCVIVTSSPFHQPRQDMRPARVQGCGIRPQPLIRGAAKSHGEWCDINRSAAVRTLPISQCDFLSCALLDVAIVGWGTPQVPSSLDLWAQEQLCRA